MIKTVSVLGARYKVVTGVSPTVDKALEGRYGYCQPTSHLIVIADMNEIPSWDGESEGITLTNPAEGLTTVAKQKVHARSSPKRISKPLKSQS